MGIIALDGAPPEPVTAFLDATVGSHGRAHWLWKYDGSRTDSPRAFYFVDGEGRVTAFLGLMPALLGLPETTLAGRWVVDWAAAPGSADVGAGVALLRRAEAATALCVILGGSLMARDILTRLRWHSEEAAADWILPLTARFLAPRITARLGPAARPVAHAAARLAAAWWRGRRPRSAVLSLREVPRFPASYDAVWADRRPEFAPVMDRSSAQMNTMCADFPGDGYRRFLLLDRGRMAGHLVLREDERGGYRRGRIVDALWPRARSEAVHWLVREACWRLQARGMDYVECTASAPELVAALDARRFRRRQPVPLWYRRLPPGVPPRGWFITYLDCDRAFR